MKTKDHLTLGNVLLNLFPDEGLHKYKRAFLLGCVEPDYNIISYTRGMRKHKMFHGHNAENSREYVKKCLSKIQTHGLKSAWDYFSLGVVLHYMADAFTWPHHADWGKSLAEHLAYEQELHKLVTHELDVKKVKEATVGPLALQGYFDGRHAKYLHGQHDIKNDYQFIVSTCKTMLAGCLLYAWEGEKELSLLREGGSYEGTYHHGLV